MKIIDNSTDKLPTLKSNILEIANKKSTVKRENLMERIRTFPLEWLSNIKYIQDFAIDKEMTTILCDDILNDRLNTLYNKNQ